MADVIFFTLAEYATGGNGNSYPFTNRKSDPKKDYHGFFIDKVEICQMQIHLHTIRGQVVKEENQQDTFQARWYW